MLNLLNSIKGQICTAQWTLIRMNLASPRRQLTNQKATGDLHRKLALQVLEILGFNMKKNCLFLVSYLWLA